MTSAGANFKCPQCDGGLKPTADPNAFECQRCGRIINERPRTAKIGTRSDGTVLGVAVFLSRVDIEALGVEAAEADRVAYCVVNGTLHLQKAEAGGDRDECAG